MIEIAVLLILVIGMVISFAAGAVVMYLARTETSVIEKVKTVYKDVVPEKKEEVIDEAESLLATITPPDMFARRNEKESFEMEQQRRREEAFH